MSEREIDRIKERAKEVVKKLSNDYEIDETIPFLIFSTTPLGEPQFKFTIDYTNRKFELHQPTTAQLKNLDIKRVLEVLNRKLKSCLEKK